MKYFSMFTGVGGFEQGINNAYDNRPNIWNGSEGSPDMSNLEKFENRPTCVGYSEIDKYAIQTYEKHYNHKNYGSCTDINWSEVPDFDLLVGGSPCQDLSIAGKRKGLTGERSGLFAEYIRGLKEKKPRYFIWENVKGVLSSNGGRDFATVLFEMEQVGYDVQWQVLNAKDFGVPQNRERVFIVGHIREEPRPEVFPFTKPSTGFIQQHGNIDQHKRDRDNPNTGRVYDIKGISPTLSCMQGGGLEPKVLVQSLIRKLTPLECERLMGWEDNWTDGVSDSQRYKQCGNGVVSNVVQAIIERLI